MNIQEVTIKFSDLIAPAFRAVHGAIKRAEYTVFWLKGGRGSTKSSFVALQIVKAIMADPQANALATRKVGSTLRNSVLANFRWAIRKVDAMEDFKITSSPPEIVYLATGQKIIMVGLDDPDKLKSVKVEIGYFKILWFEELPEFAGMDEIRSVEQSVMRGGEEFIEFMTYNPPNDPQAWVNKEAKAREERMALGKGDTLVHSSTYLDVPEEWLGSKFLHDARQLLLTDPLKYNHQYLGQTVGNTEAIIFSGHYSVQEFEVEDHWHGPYDGLDFGFSQDPLAAVRVWIDDTFVHGKKKRLYVEREAFGVGVELDEIPQFLQKIPGYGKNRKGTGACKIRADCSLPAQISHIKGKGFDIIGAEKWPGSVEEGITVMKSFDIIVHPRCVRLIEEFGLYCYKIDKLTGDVLTIIVDKFNHGIDAIRYAIAPFIKRKGESVMSILGSSSVKRPPRRHDI